MVSRPLEGLRVLDLTRFVAGSQTTALLAAFGADVVKLEVPPEGDPYRAQGTVRLAEESVLFLSLNSGKRSLALDFRSELATEAVDRLLASSQFVVENARPGSLARYGLDWGSVHERYPSIVYGSISGYGDVGPDAARGGFDLILQAESGVMSITGSEASGPVKVGRAGARCRRGACVRVRPSGGPRRARADRDRDARVAPTKIHARVSKVRWITPSLRGRGGRSMSRARPARGRAPGRAASRSRGRSPGSASR